MRGGRAWLCVVVCGGRAWSCVVVRGGRAWSCMVERGRRAWSCVVVRGSVRQPCVVVRGRAWSCAAVVRGRVWSCVVVHGRVRGRAWSCAVVRGRHSLPCCPLRGQRCLDARKDGHTRGRTTYNTPLNPPGVGWVNFFYPINVIVSIRTCVPNLGSIRGSVRKNCLLSLIIDKTFSVLKILVSS